MSTRAISKSGDKLDEVQLAIFRCFDSNCFCVAGNRRQNGGGPDTNAAGPSVGAGEAEGGSAMSIPEGMIANNGCHDTPAVAYFFR